MREYPGVFRWKSNHKSPYKMETRVRGEDDMMIEVQIGMMCFEMEDMATNRHPLAENASKWFLQKELPLTTP